MDAHADEGLSIYLELHGLHGTDDSCWMTAQDQQLAVLHVTLPNGESFASLRVMLKRRGGARVYFVLPMPTSAFITGKPFLLEWGGEQKPDLGHKSVLPWAIVLRLLPGEVQTLGQAVPPEKAPAPRVCACMGHIV